MGKPLEFEQREQARRLAWEFYRQAQPGQQVPAWIVLNGATVEEKEESGLWLVRSYLFKIHELPDGLFEERGIDGSKQLVRRDPETGERGIVISYDVEDSLMSDIFLLEVDLSSLQVTPKTPVAVEQLRPEDFMLTYDNFDLTKAWRFDQSFEQNRRTIFRRK